MLSFCSVDDNSPFVSLSWLELWQEKTNKAKIISRLTLRMAIFRLVCDNNISENIGIGGEKKNILI